MDINELAGNLAYANTEDIKAMAFAIDQFLRKRADGADTRTEVNGFASALRYVIDPYHICGGPSFGRLTDGCKACDQLKAGRPAKPGYASERRYSGEKRR